MNHKLKIKLKSLIYSLFLVAISSITTVYAVTIIASKDVIYDNSKSGSSATDVQSAIDDLYTKAKSCGSGSSSNKNTNLINYITNLAKTDTTNLAYDGTADNNLRYIGSNPNNYVEFNGELWRIIGVMNNVTDSDKNKTSRVKLIRAESIGEIAWNSNNVNDWSTATLQKLLNSGDYYNRKNTYSSTGLTDDAKSMISNVVWNLGGYTSSGASASAFYKYERGKTGPSGYATEWTGNVGLMFPSDFGYAVGGDVRSICLNANLGNYDSNKCYTDDWLYLSSTQWTLTPNSGNSSALLTYTSGRLGSNTVEYIHATRPVVYLNTDIKVTGGKGTEDNPYKLTDKVTTPVEETKIEVPKLDDDVKLIPVILDDDGKVTYTSKDDTKWYNYAEKKWANAVILIDSPSQSYKVGDTIKEEDIESYFVWIPKYKYKLWNVDTTSGTKHEIDIVFDTQDTTDVEGVSCKTPMTSGETGNCNNGEYMTHPAFISLGVDGFWVGKFETGYKDAKTTADAQVNSSASSNIIIKPNVYSWRNNTVYNFFVSAYNYERDLDSHMMKNTEWGAVAYLSHSKYGINQEVNINNNSSYKTGYSALSSTNQSKYPGTYGDEPSYNQAYNTEIGYKASTTGNITGVYDMSGGAHEYMASYKSGSLGSSGFTTTTVSNYNAKYFDVYNSSSGPTTYQYRILGDATGEMGPFNLYADSDGSKRWHNSWYGDAAHYIYSDSPWFCRGGYYGNGVLAGQFYFDRSVQAYDSHGSRLVLVG